MVKNTHLLNGHVLKVHIGIASTLLKLRKPILKNTLHVNKKYVHLSIKCAPTTYVTEIKETYFEIFTKQVPCPLAFLF